MTRMRRRKFITLLGGAAAAWPIAAGAQQRPRMRRIGALFELPADDPTSLESVAGLLQGLQELNWVVGRNVQIEYRWGAIDDSVARKHAAELVALVPDVLVTRGGRSVRALQAATRSLPIVFTAHNDPVGAGTVASLARPGGNITGFAGPEYGLAVKFLELLKEIAPQVKRIAVVRDTLGGIAPYGVIQAAVPLFGVELTPIDPRGLSDIERAVTAFARGPNGGMIVTGTTLAYIHRERIIELAARHRLPTVYSGRLYVAAGGLISYGAVNIEMYRRAAGYIDRILKGENPSDLPVQAPVKYETVLNLKTAKALGIQVPDTVLVRADEVIE
jgi:putative ABC transport system substrate-binding protein